VWESSCKKTLVYVRYYTLWHYRLSMYFSSHASLLVYLIAYAFWLLCFIRCFLVKLYILFNLNISTVLPSWWWIKMYNYIRVPYRSKNWEHRNRRDRGRDGSIGRRKKGKCGTKGIDRKGVSFTRWGFSACSDISYNKQKVSDSGRSAILSELLTSSSSASYMKVDDMCAHRKNYQDEIISIWATYISTLRAFFHHFNPPQSRLKPSH